MLNRFLDSILQKGLTISPAELDKLSRYGYLEQNNVTRAYEYLDSNNLLNQQIFDVLIRIATTPSSIMVGSIKLKQPYNQSYFMILNALNRHHIKISDEHVYKIFSLNEKSAGFIASIIQNLDHEDMLNYDSFKQAMERVTSKLTPPASYEFTKVKRRSWVFFKKPSILTIGPHTVYLSENSKMRGAEGIVKMGHDDVGKLSYVIKSYGGENFQGPPDTLEKIRVGRKKQVIKETKYLNLLGRTAGYYNKDKETDAKYRVLTTYISGKEVGKHTQQELIEKTQLHRLECLKMVLSELNVLHSNFRRHGDLHGANILLDLTRKEMRLIDFGLGHKGFPYTDLTDMGKVVGQMFPELYSVKDTSRGKEYILINKPLTLQEAGIVKLVDALMNPKNELKCTSLDALQYCDQLIQNFDSLTEQSLNEISSKTINRTETTVEDILRGAIRTRPDAKKSNTHDKESRSSASTHHTALFTSTVASVDLPDDDKKKQKKTQ